VDSDLGILFLDCAEDEECYVDETSSLGGRCAPVLMMKVTFMMTKEWSNRIVKGDWLLAVELARLLY
jgi:hypothetical protein